ncbi:transcriptional regulator [Actinomadura soli]|uniref:Transcriptional regulator n=1 Tax=Actinomadura soli TaxID=2508997 RepID=A0A5C4J402_9ACTN|nr:DUF5753 domain-containing protein [Actinomadura soli]TMQ91508.1 transcriptional regulator [Actinomadura soli]
MSCSEGGSGIGVAGGGLDGEAGCRCTTGLVWVPQCEPDAVTRPRLLLAARLRGLRDRRQVPVEAAAATIGSPVLLQAMERGVTASSPHHVMLLATLYGVTDHADRSVLLQLALHSRQEGWWEPYRSLIRPGFLPYLGAEQAAQMIRGYAVDAVPDLLQHPDYARVLIKYAHPRAGDGELRRRLELRLRRQQILYAADPPRVWMVIDEAVLRRRAASTTVMYRQLEHLLDLCELPHVTIQIMPLTGAAVLPGPITLVRVLQERDVTRLAYLQQLGTAMYFQDADQARHWMNKVAVQAARPDQTPGLLRQAIQYLAGGVAASADDGRDPSVTAECGG